MSIPREVNTLIQRLNSKLDQLEQETTDGLNPIRVSLNLFPGNALLIQLFAYLNNALLFTETLRRRIDYSSTVLATGMAMEQIEKSLKTSQNNSVEY